MPSGGGYLQVASSKNYFFTDASNTNVVLRTVDNDNKLLIGTGSNLPSTLTLFNGRLGLGTTTPSEKLDVIGNVRISSNLTVNSNLTVHGDLTVFGNTTSIETTQLVIEDNVVVLNKNQTGIPPSDLISGLEIERGDLTNYQIVFEEATHLFKVGQVGALQTLATRSNLMNDRAIGIWDNTEEAFVNTPDATITSEGNLTVKSVLTTDSNAGVQIYGTDTTKHLWLARDTNDAFLRLGNSTTRSFQFQFGSDTTSGIGTDTPYAPAMTITSMGIGIGTTVPQRHLDVRGDINILGGDLYSNNVRVVSSQWTGSNTSHVYVSPNTRVGIGTTIPTRTLDVRGDINLIGNLFSNSTRLVSSQWTGSDGLNVFLAGPTTKVGIATNNPLRTLDVRGDINMVGDLYSNSVRMVSSQWIGSNTSQLYVSPNTTIGIGTTVPTRTLDVRGDINFTGALYSNDQLYISSQWTGNDGDVLTVSPGTRIGVGTTTLAQNARLHVSSTNVNNALIVDATTGSIGIGTTTDSSYVMNINGNINFIGNLYSNNELFVSGGGSGAGTGFVENGLNLYVNPGSNVGIGTTAPDPNVDFHVAGSMRVDGVLYSDSNNVVWIPGGQAKWYPLPSPLTISVPTGGSFNAIKQNGQYQYVADNVIYNFFVRGTVVSKPTDPTADYTISLPAPLSTVLYENGAVVGDLWVTIENVVSMTTYKAYAKYNSSDNTTVSVRFLSGTYDRSLSSLEIGNTVTMQGTVVYRANTVLYPELTVPSTFLPAKLYQDTTGRVYFNRPNIPNQTARGHLDILEKSNNIPALFVDHTGTLGDRLQIASNGFPVIVVNSNNYLGIGNTNPTQPLDVLGDINFSGILRYNGEQWFPPSMIEWTTASTAPAFKTPLPTGASVVSYSDQTAMYRYLGNEVIYNFYLTATIQNVSTNLSDDYSLALEVPAATYTKETVVGDLWMTVTNVATDIKSTFKAYAQIPANDTTGSSVKIRYLSGTYDRSLTSLGNAQNIITLQGTIIYKTKTKANPELNTPLAYIPAALRQDGDGRVSLNRAPNQNPRARFDVTETTSGFPVVTLDQTQTGDIVQIMSNGSLKVCVNSSGFVGIGTTNPLSALDVYGNARVIDGTLTVSSNSFQKNNAVVGQVNNGDTWTLPAPTNGTGWEGEIKIVYRNDDGFVATRNYTFYYTPSGTNSYLSEVYYKNNGVSTTGTVSISGSGLVTNRRFDFVITGTNPKAVVYVSYFTAL
jgi:hypothetical protein